MRFAPGLSRQFAGAMQGGFTLTPVRGTTAIGANRKGKVDSMTDSQRDSGYSNPKKNQGQQAPPILEANHAQLIKDSAIDEAVARQRGYRTVRSKAELERLGFGRNQCKVPALLIPIYGASGKEPVNYQIRPDEPRIKKGKPLKYEFPSGTHAVIDVPLSSRAQVADPNSALFITEGARKADAAVSQAACCIAILGVWNWRGTNEKGGKVALPDWENIALNGRTIYIVFDSDVMVKPGVHKALCRLKPFLESRGGEVLAVYLKPTDGGQKVGLDDYLAAGNTIESLISLATSKLQVPNQAEQVEKFGVTKNGGTNYLKQTADGDVIPIHLANFHAKIVGDVTEENGLESRRLFELEASLNGAIHTFDVRVERFASMSWVTENLGPKAIVVAGMGGKDLLREAVQTMSDEDIECRKVHTCTGWILLESGKYLYVCANGAIGSGGFIDGIEVRVDPPLDMFTLPSPPEGPELVAAVRTSLGILDGLAPDEVIFPIYAGIWTPLVHSNGQSIHIAGGTGQKKTELASLAQSHFGAGMDAHNLPASWASTGNYLETLGFYAKDALLVVDDFCPAGTSADVQRLNRDADRLIRGQANSRGRGRLRADGERQAALYPRGLILSTGEELPGGHSLRARLFTVDVPQDSVDLLKLTECQANRDAFSKALSGFVEWLASRLPGVRMEFQSNSKATRDLLNGDVSHGRTASLTGELLAGLQVFLRFCIEIGGITEDEFNRLMGRASVAMIKVARNQFGYLQDAEPAMMFVEQLGAALRSGGIHLVDRKTGSFPAPKDLARAAGWRYQQGGNAGWKPCGPQVGWIDTEDKAVYLDPKVAFSEVVRSAGDASCRINVGDRTLWKALAERGLIASHDAGRNLKKVRITSRSLSVLHLHLDDVIGSEGLDGQGESGFVPDTKGDVPFPESVTGTESGQKSGLSASSRGPVPDVPVVPLNGEVLSDFQEAGGATQITSSHGKQNHPRLGKEDRACLLGRGTKGTTGTHPAHAPEKADYSPAGVPDSDQESGTGTGTSGARDVEPAHVDQKNALKTVNSKVQL